jgi:hypothetical protein
MLNRIIYGDDILAHAKSLAIKALYIKWKTLSQLMRLTLTDFLDSDEKVSSNFLIMLHTGNDDYAVIYHGSEHRRARPVGPSPIASERPHRQGCAANL